MVTYQLSPLRKMERAFDRIFGLAPFPTLGVVERLAGEWPRVAAWETQEGLQIECEVPGLTREDVQVELLGDEITIRGGRRETREDQESGHCRPQYEFTRRFTLPVAVDLKKAKAELSDGLLRVNLPKSAQAKAHNIPVK